MSKLTKLFYLSAAICSGMVFDGCFGGLPNVYSWGWPRAIWLWLMEDLVTH